MPGIVLARGSAPASGRFWAMRCSATQPVMPSPNLTAQLLRRLVDVLADLALHRDRDQVVAAEAIDADVVVVDQLAELGRDRQADLALVASRDRRAPSCWIDWSWAAQVAIFS